MIINSEMQSKQELLRLDLQKEDLLARKIEKLFELEIEDCINEILVVSKSEFTCFFTRHMELVIKDLYGDHCFLSAVLSKYFNQVLRYYCNPVYEAITCDLNSFKKKTDSIQIVSTTKKRSDSNSSKSSNSTLEAINIKMELSKTIVLQDANKKMISSRFQTPFSIKQHANEQLKSDKTERSDSLICIQDGFIRHCFNDRSTYAHHYCDGKMVLVKNVMLSKLGLHFNTSKVDYVVCSQCKLSYFSTSFEVKCKLCDDTYYSSMFPEFKTIIVRTSSSKIQKSETYASVTWDKYHCKVILNEPLKCNKCGAELYSKLADFKMKMNLDIKCYCLSCNIDILPRNTKWNCISCQLDFTSGIKVFNKLELKEFRLAIKDALVFGKRIAKPQELPCCNYSVDSLDFFHSKNCSGTPFEGVIKHKPNLKVIVCSLCKAVCRSDVFIWTCPICYKNFRFRSASIRSNSFNYDSQQKIVHFENDKGNNDKAEASCTKFTNMSYIEKQLSSPESINYYSVSGYNSGKTINYDEVIDEKKNANDRGFGSTNSKIVKRPAKVINCIDTRLNTIASNQIGSIRQYLEILKSKPNQQTGLEPQNQSNKGSINDTKKTDYKSSSNTQDRHCDSKTDDLSATLIKERKSHGESEKQDKITSKIIAEKVSEVGRIGYKKKKIENSKSINFYATNSNSKNPTEQIPFVSDSNLLDSNYVSVRSDIGSKFTFSMNNYDANFKSLKKHCSPKAKVAHHFKTTSTPVYGEKGFDKPYIKMRCPSKVFGITTTPTKPNKKDLEEIISKAERQTNEFGTAENFQKVDSFNGSALYDSNLISPSSDCAKSYSNFRPNKLLANLKKEGSKNQNAFQTSNKKSITLDLKGSDIDCAFFFSPEQLVVNIKTFNINDYKIVRKIGDGSYGSIYEAKDKQGKEFAIKKIIAYDDLELECFKQEFTMLSSIKHPNILTVHAICMKAIDNNGTNALYVLMDLAISDWNTEIKSRKDSNNEFSLQELTSITYQISNAMSFLQKHQISHRDLKPHNVLKFRNNIYKISDFGEAKFYFAKPEEAFQATFKSRKSTAYRESFTLRGTELYMSPLLFQALKQEEQNLTHDPIKSDVYSLGLCILYALFLNINLLYQLKTFPSDTTNLIYQENHRLDRRLLPGKGDWFLDLVNQMLSLLECERPDFFKIKGTIEDQLGNVNIKILK